MKVLIVEDDSDTRLVMRKIIRTITKDVSDVENGKTAVKVVQETIKAHKRFDLILLDIELTDMSGVTVLSTIRAIEEEEGIGPEACSKIIMVSSHSDKDNVINAIKSGCDAYMIKPFNKAGVIQRIESVGLCVNTASGAAMEAELSERP